MLLKIVIVLVALTATIEGASKPLKRMRKDLSSLPLKLKKDHFSTLVRKRRETEDEEVVIEAIDVEPIDMIKFFIAEAWEDDKLGMLAEYMTDESDHESNMTVIGWQRVFDETGKISQLVTVQIVIPPKPLTEIDVARTDDDDDDDDSDEDDERLLPHDDINEMKELFEPMARLGIPLSMTMESYDKKGKCESLLYMDKDELYGKSEGFALYNKTAIASEKEVSDFIDSLKPAGLGKPSILKYDVDGHLILEHSNIRPHMLGDVIDHVDATDEMLIEGPQIIAQISQQYPKDSIPKHLAIEYNKKYPEYKWRVLVSPENYYITRDVSLSLSYDNFDLDENSYVWYLVYGAKKTKN
ncbi:uncharacterized protein LOC123003765 [Tribolium madens]|uniref:uncharacterized protein LOC123003765 n=1 Tax=Tribolium madens TaxID=41895 RepID=UPI001CF762C8|nr:uncharacterized protein LOC123003765 [Tribolium madens]